MADTEMIHVVEIRKRADEGDAEAQDRLGWCYESGIGATQNNAEAVKWYRLAADQGNASAQNNLGWCCEFGIGGAPQDDAEAVKWYRLAADQGNPSGRRILAACYEFGEGVPKDLIEADKCYRLVPGQDRDFSERSAG